MNNKSILFKGLCISSGRTLGRVCLFNESRHTNITEYNINEEDIEREKNRIKQAIQNVLKKIKAITKTLEVEISQKEADIFEAHKMILDDSSLKNKILLRIEAKKKNAEACVKEVLEEYEEKLSKVNSEYIKERISDIEELKNKILNELRNLSSDLKCAGQEHCAHGYNRIVIAKELSPYLIMEMKKYSKIRGFITEKGGISSHAAILAKTLGIPALSGIKDIYENFRCGDLVLLDADNSLAILNPSEEEIKKSQAEISKKIKILSSLKDFKVLSNISSFKEIDDVLKYKSDGIGLYRTEFEFILQNKLISEEEQTDIYKKVLEKTKKLPIYFRMLDIGGDKPLDFIKIEKEDNPYLGLRGTRFLLAHPEILRLQARAIAKASMIKKIHIMFPMIVDYEQFIKIKTIFLEEIKDIKNKKLSFGIMFEVPSLIFELKKFSKKDIDFVSIGTNDLIQYLFAVDRNNALVANDYKLEHSALWDTIKRAYQICSKKSIDVSVCGELASIPVYAEKIKRIGIKKISVNSNFIPEIRAYIKNN